MKKKLFFLSIFQCVFLFGQQTPAATLTENLRSDYRSFIKSTERLALLAQDSSISWIAQEEQFKSTQLAYKKIEGFIAYLDNEYAGDHFNGAPLPRIARKTSQLIVVDPSGLQTIGEVLLEQNQPEFAQLSKQLYQRASEFLALIERIKLSERMVFESTRESLIRLAALGITGFDSPIEEQTLPACQVVVQSIENTLQAYSTFCSPDELKKQEALFLVATNFFVNQNFENFNRFDFIRLFVDPLYKELLEFQKRLNIPTRDLGSEIEYSVNYQATSIFDTDFLNYKYYSKYSNAGIQENRESLGKLLFFDPILSHDNERSCASCHNPMKAFTDGQTKSVATGNAGTVQRNSPTLMNSVYNTRFFWDVRASTPEDQIEHVIFSEKEFNTNYEEIMSKINSSNVYVALFKAAYPELENGRFPSVSRYTLVASISAYLQSLRSFKSPFDKAIKGEKTASPDLVNGFNIFSGKAKCATCHFIPTFAGNVPPLYTETETEIIGVPNINQKAIAELDGDLGRFSNGRPKEKAAHQRNAFKTVSLRNVALTPPYMHNGVFNTLEEVIDFYNVGGGHGWGIAPENATLSSDSLLLTPTEIKQMIYFLESLTDTTGFTTLPTALPVTKDPQLNKRKVGGSY